ncbi:MAG TPA: redoxin family protein [Candidatus Dormibacteraeota bacterium]|nr:redoxin family protein [Candidatus Dormibacteraeota bacterium]
MFPSLDGATTWLNSPPLTPAGLRGKVVVVQFWTYTCINWRRTHPYVRAWASRYGDKGLVVVGVHTPEFGFEHDLANVRLQAKAMGVDWPVAVDNDFEVWRAFANHYWPALYFIDAQGRIRHHRFGEGDYERSEMVVRLLLADAGVEDLPEGLAATEAVGAEVEADWADLGSPETYTGSDQATNFDETNPSRLRLNHWSIAGDWTVRPDAIALNKPGGRIAFQFHARDLHLVMGPATRGTSVRFRVLLDGKQAGDAHGTDLENDSTGILTEQRMYQLIKQSKPIDDQRFEIEFLDAGVEAFCFTFG